MRIWSIHPKYLDSKGLVALWRETLLAKNVLEGKTKGYKNHPQLDRFKNYKNPIAAINYYLQYVWLEADERGYRFDKSKCIPVVRQINLFVTNGQMKFEREHLLNKLKIRDEQRYNRLKSIEIFEPHPLFTIVKGDIEIWERN